MMDVMDGLKLFQNLSYPFSYSLQIYQTTTVDLTNHVLAALKNILMMRLVHVSRQRNYYTEIMIMVIVAIAVTTTKIMAVVVVIPILIVVVVAPQTLTLVCF
jgi:hypothetical protein